MLPYNSSISFGFQKTGWAFGGPVINEGTKDLQNGLICSRPPAHQRPRPKVNSSLSTTRVFPRYRCGSFLLIITGFSSKIVEKMFLKMPTFTIILIFGEASRRLYTKDKGRKF